MSDNDQSQADYLSTRKNVRWISDTEYVVETQAETARREAAEWRDLAHARLEKLRQLDPKAKVVRNKRTGGRTFRTRLRLHDWWTGETSPITGTGGSFTDAVHDAWRNMWDGIEGVRASLTIGGRDYHDNGPYGWMRPARETIDDAYRAHERELASRRAEAEAIASGELSGDDVARIKWRSHWLEVAKFKEEPELLLMIYNAQRASNKVSRQRPPRGSSSAA